MIKLKNLLKEGFAWERNADGSLPTLADATKNHQKNLQEQSSNRLQPLIDMGFELEKMGNGQTVATLEKGSNNIILIIGTNAVFKGLYTIAGKKGMLAGTIDDKYIEMIKAKVAKMGITEVLKDKDGNVRTDLKYKDNQNYQPRIELKNTKMGSGTNLTITVSIDGSTPFDIEFDDYDEVDDHGYEKAIYLMGADDGGNEWGMEGSMAFHGELEDFNIDTLEKMEK
jgi:hypothetical protein